LNVSVEKPLFNAQININGSMNLMEASRNTDVKKFIFSSASSLVGEVKYDPVDEDHPLTPKTPYGTAKLAIEHYLRVYNEIFGLNYLVFRFFNLYGKYQYPESRALIPMIYNRVSKGQEFTIFGDGSATRDFIFIDDVVDFYMKAVTDKFDVKNEVVNMGTGTGTSILEIVKTSAELLEVEPNLKYEPKKPGEIENFTADTKKLQELFGDVPKTSVRDGLGKTFEWLKSLE
jgi:UDP-glucose 4-epimerase